MLSDDIDWTCDVCKRTFESFHGLCQHRHKSCYVYKNYNIKQYSKKNKQIIESLEEEEYPIGRQDISSVLHNTTSSSSFSANINLTTESSSPFGKNDNHHDENNFDQISPGPFFEEANEDIVEPVLLSSLSAENNNLVNNKYMDFQRKFISLTINPKQTTNQTNNNSGLSSHLNLGRVSSITSSTIGHNDSHGGKPIISTGFANPRDVLNIFIYIKTHWMSEGNGDALLELIKQLFRNHPPIDDFFLHRNMKSINKALNRSMESLYTANEIHTTLPYKLRGSSITERVSINNILNKRDRNPQLIIASGIGMDLIMEVLSEILVSHDFDYFDFLPILDVNDGIRSYSTFASAKLFHKTFEEVQQICGTDVYPFCFQLALDGTPIASGGVGNKSITPVNIRFLQVKNKAALNDEDNCSLVGFSPSFTVSNFDLP